MDGSNNRWWYQSPQGSMLTKDVRNVNDEYCSNLSLMERMAIFMAERVGTPGFFLIIAVWTLGWVLWNLYGPKEYRFDIGMRFEVWIFVSNALQILLMPLLLIAQNLQSRHDELRAENDFQTTVESKKEIEVILAHLYMLNENVKGIMDHLEISQEALRKKNGIPDLVEEQFAERQQQLLNEMAIKLAMTHESALEQVKKFNGLK